MAKIMGAFMADGSLSIQIIMASKLPDTLKMAISKMSKLNINYSRGYVPSRLQYYISVQVNSNNMDSIKKLLSLLNQEQKLFIQTHYTIELTDMYKDNVEMFNNWILKEFNIKPTNMAQKKNAWRTIFSNKILSRYLIQFFNVKPGPKTNNTFEPQNIKASNLSRRKQFAKGVLMFDGCVTQAMRMTISIKSPFLFNSLKDIWKKDNIKFGETKNKREEYVLSSILNTHPKKIIKYFEPNTQKNKLIKWLSGDTKEKPIINENNLASYSKILELLKKINKCDISFLCEYFKCSRPTIMALLRTLKRQQKIILTKKPKCICHNVDLGISVLLKKGFHKKFFKSIRDATKKYKTAIQIIDTNKSTFSAWKQRKNRIPKYILVKLQKLPFTDRQNLHDICRNIKGVDRYIVEPI
ncbi:MAG: hypothetical protein ABH833_04265 [Parcubacteria group bacterium]